MSDHSLDKLTMGDMVRGASGGMGGPRGSPGKISPVNIPPPLAEEDSITSPTADEDDMPPPTLRPLPSRIVNDDDEEEDCHPEFGSSLDVEFLKRVLLGKDISPPNPKMNRRTYSCEQSSGHLWANPARAVVRMNPRKRTSAPQFGRTNTIKNTIVLRSRRSWPVAPPRVRRFDFHFIESFYNFYTYIHTYVLFMHV